MVQIYSKYNRPKIGNEPGGGKSLIEKGSSIPVMQQVRDMIAAGERLGVSRQGAYDFDPGVEVPKDTVPDPTRSSTFDLADGTRLLNEIEEEIHNSKEEVKNVPENTVEATPPVTETVDKGET